MLISYIIKCTKPICLLSGLSSQHPLHHIPCREEGLMGGGGGLHEPLNALLDSNKLREEEMGEGPEQVEET